MKEKNIGQNLATKLVLALGYKLNIFLLEVNFDKFTIGLHLLLISLILAKFQENKISIKSLNFVVTLFFIFGFRYNSVF